MAAFREVQQKHANYGACDTEPDMAFCTYVAEVLEGGDLEGPAGWDIFDHMKGADDVNAALTAAAEDVGEEVQRMRKKLIWLQDEIWRTALEWPFPTKEESASPSVLGRVSARPSYAISMPVEHILVFAEALKKKSVDDKPVVSDDLAVVPVKTTLAGIQQLVARLMACMQQRREMFTVEVLFD